MVGSDHNMTWIDRPFAPPLEAVLRLPPPPSVNTTRKIDWGNARKHKDWIRAADMSVMAHGGLRALTKMPGRFEAILTIDENLNHLDLDNSIKAVIDYARRIELVIDDGPKYLRKVTVEWGHAPHGCKLTLRSVL